MVAVKAWTKGKGKAGGDAEEAGRGVGSGAQLDQADPLRRWMPAALPAANDLSAHETIWWEPLYTG